MRGRIALIAILFATLRAAPALAQSNPVVQPEPVPIAQPEPTILVTTSGTRYLYEISQSRGATLPQWDPATDMEPPLALGAARNAAEAWLASQNPLIKAFTLTSASLLRFFADGRLENCGPAGCWYYRMTFEPAVGGVGLSDGAEIVVVVLLDGSIVPPRGAVPSAVRAVEPPNDSRRSPAPTPDANGVYRLGNGVWSPRVIRMVKPRYTAPAMRARVEGTVVLDCVVKKDGTVGDVRIAMSLDAGLDEEAIKAVKQWTFAPGTLRDEPVAVFATCQVEFKLK